MLEYKLPKIVNAHSNDPSWMRSLKGWCNDVTRILRKIRQLQGDGVSIVIDDNVIRSLNSGVSGSFAQTPGGTNNELIGIADGFLHVHGIGHYYFSQEDMTLAGGPFVFIYLWALTSDYSQNGLSIANGADAEDIPVSGSGRVNVVLWQYELDMVTGKYSSPVARAGGQDVHFMTPVRN